MAKSEQNFVSVIIPAYNSAEVVGEAIESILGQTYSNFELIIIDDCSTDDTWAVVSEYKQRDGRIRAYKNDINLGIGGNRARGIELAKGRYICWQDADDISLPDRVELQARCLDDNPEVGVVGGFLEFFGKDTRPSVRKYAPKDVDLRRAIFRYNPIAQPASMFRKECYDKVGSYDPSYRFSEDLEMFFRVGAVYEFANVQRVVLKYRQDQKSLTHANLRKMEWATIKIRLQYANHPAYAPNWVDYAYNICQILTMVIPSRLKVALFNHIRNSKKAE